MAGDPTNGPVDPAEAQFRRRARYATLAVTLGLCIAEVLADIVSNLFQIGAFHANEAIIGTLIGGGVLAGVLGISGLRK